MINTLKKFSLVILVLALVVADFGIAGRGDKAGTAAAPMLLIPVGGRDIAMGASTVANSFGIEAVHYNPAGIAWGKKQSEAIFSHMNYIADIGVDYIGVSSNFAGFGVLALTIKSLSIGSIEITTENNPDGTGETFNPQFTTIGLTYANAMTDRISVGLTVNLISEQIDRASSSGIGFDFGVQYKNFANVGGLDLGVAIKNVGPQMQYEGPGLIRRGQVDDVIRSSSYYALTASKAELPSVIELGFAYKMSISEQSQLNLASIFQNQNLSDDEYKFGGEFVWDNTFFVRGGYNVSQDSYKESYIFGATFGAGISQNFDGLDFTFDYAYRDVQFFDANHVFSVKLGF
ncbi:MAG: PorV/PorQ family protein [Bacteroidota bacterium]